MLNRILDLSRHCRSLAHELLRPIRQALILEKADVLYLHLEQVQLPQSSTVLQQHCSDRTQESIRVHRCICALDSLIERRKVSCIETGDLLRSDTEKPAQPLRLIELVSPRLFFPPPIIQSLLPLVPEGNFISMNIIPDLLLLCRPWAILVPLLFLVGSTVLIEQKLIAISPCSARIASRAF